MNPIVLDNICDTVRDDMKKIIRRGSKISVAAPRFSIYAYDALKKNLDRASDFRFIFTSPTFVETLDDKAQREFYIPKLNRERSLYGTDFELKLRNDLTQGAVARDCVEWIRRCATFKSNVTDEFMSGFALVENKTDRVAYSPLNGFTGVDLGCQRGNYMCNLVNRIEPPAAEIFFRTFNSLWNNNQNFKDVTDAVIENLSSVYAENSPALIYFMTLYNVFNEFLNDISEDVLPDEATGFKHSQIWSMLYDFQRDAVLAIINKLEQFNGCILADSVGLGKTFSALAVIKYYENRNRAVLVLCPKKLADNWNTFKSNYKNNPIAADRLRYDVLFHTDLMRARGESNGIDLSRINWGNYDLVVIDESHNFRNGGDYIGDDQRENRYLRLMNKVIRAGVRTKVLMLSATPVNNRFYDLRNQLALAYEGTPETLESKLNTSKSVDDIFRQAQQAFNGWLNLPPPLRTTDNLLKRLDFDFFKLLDSVTIARSRKHVERYYNADAIGKFPQRLKPISLRPRLTDLPDAINYNSIYNRLSELSLDIYTPSAYIFESRLKKYLSPLESGSNLTQAGRERGIQRLMRVNLLKRLESSVHSFRLTLRRILERIADAVKLIDDFTQSGAADFNPLRAEPSDFDDEAQNTDYFTEWKNIRIDLRDMDYIRWRAALEADADIIKKLLAAVDGITPEHDAKLSALLNVIADKIRNPINGANKKILIFSAFADTAEYLFDHVSRFVKNNFDLETALVTGTGHRQKIARAQRYSYVLFARLKKSRRPQVARRHRHRYPHRHRLYFRGAKPSGLRLLHQLRHSLESRPHHSALRAHRSHRQRQLSNSTRKFLARPASRRVHQSQGARRDQNEDHRLDRHRRRQSSQPRGAGRSRISSAAVEAPDGRSCRP